MFSDPLVQSTALPLLSALLLFWFLRFVLSQAEPDLPLAAAAVVVGFLIAYWAILGLPPLPPTASSQKLAYVCVIGLVFGLVVDLFHPRLPSSLVPAFCLIWPGVVAYWLAWPRVVGIDLFAILGALGLWIGGALAFYRLGRVRDEQERSLAPGIMLLAFGLGAGALALYFASASLSQLAFAMAAALGGVLLWNWFAVIRRPDGIAPFGRGALFGSASALLAIVDNLALYTETSYWAVALLLPIIYANLVLADRPRGDGPVARTLRPVFLFIVCLIPVALLGTIVYLLDMLMPI